MTGIGGVGAIGSGMIGGGMIGGGMRGGPVGGMAGAEGSAAVGAGQQAASAGNAPVQPSTTVTISDAAQKALSSEGSQVAGASFSVTQDSGGHNYVGGYDANGFSNPEASVMNGFSQASNRLDDLLAVAILALMTPDKQDANPVVIASVAAAATQAYQAMQAAG